MPIRINDTLRIIIDEWSDIARVDETSGDHFIDRCPSRGNSADQTKGCKH